jgi:hypothetical protein
MAVQDGHKETIPSDPSKVSGLTLARVALTLFKEGDTDMGVKYLELAVERLEARAERYPEAWLYG